MSLRDSIADLMSHIRYDSSTREEALEVADEILSLPAMKQKDEQLNRMREALKYFSDKFNSVDNGHCMLCGEFRTYDLKGNATPSNCENPLCWSHGIDELEQALSDTEGKWLSKP